MKRTDWPKFAEKVRMAVESSVQDQFERGTSGLELEFNILDSRFRPVVHVGYGPEHRSFADFLHGEYYPSWVGKRSHLEVFNWMTEMVTRPYYHPMGTALEGRALEAAVRNALSRAGLAFGERFHALHGNLLFPVEPTRESIPQGWSLARKNYLGKCVSLYGAKLATAGIHTNHSYPEALLSWDFFHLPRHRREGRTLIDFRNDAVIRATRLLRPFCPLFIAVSASTPLSWQGGNGEPEMVLTENDSNRLLSFPNPESLDAPYLYASHEDYLRISYDLVRRGVRFGANNWTPVRARSDVDPVSRNIMTTSEQLRELYRKGLYTVSGGVGMEEAEQELIKENLCARVDLPMNRVEVRTDEGGDDLSLSAAKIAFKELLMLRIYADEAYGAGYAYDTEDIVRARMNEEAAARNGLRAVIEDPFTGGEIPLREFLGQTLEDVAPLADALEYRELLAPIQAMAEGGPNTAESMRTWIRDRLGETVDGGSGQSIPMELLLEWLDLQAATLVEECRDFPAALPALGDEAAKISELLSPFEEESRRDPSLPYCLGPAAPSVVYEGAGDFTQEVLALSSALIRIPSVTNCPNERLEEVERCATFLAGVLKKAGAEVRLFSMGKYPSLMAGFPGKLLAPVTLGGHFDVVEPDPNDSQFDPRVEGDYLWGRGSADMKTVVATTCTWFNRALAAGPPYPPMNLMLIGNEENGEAEPYGTVHILEELYRESRWVPEFMVLGERTGEKGDETFGEICTENRGLARLRFTMTGERRHTGVGEVPSGILQRLMEAREVLNALLVKNLTLESQDRWCSAAHFPFIKVGEPGVYNIAPAEGTIGLEIRSLPSEDLTGLIGQIREICSDYGMELEVQVLEEGVACPESNPHLGKLIHAVGEVSGEPARLGKKLAGTSARFAPGGNAVVWGQTGKGPHSRHECHYIPSIEPYAKILDALARLELETSEGVPCPSMI